MDSKYKKLTLNTIIFAFGSFGSKAVSFFLVPLYTNILSTSEYGISDLIVTISGLLLPLFSISMGEAILFYGIKAKERSEINVLFKNGFIVVITGCLFLALLSPLFNLYHPLDGYTWFLPLFAIFEILRTYLRYSTKAYEKNMLYSADSIIYALVVATLNILFLLVFKWKVKGYLLAYIFAEFFSFCFLFVSNSGFICLRDCKIKKETVFLLIKYSAPLMLNSIMWAISSSSDKIMLESMISSSAVGLYSAASKIPTIVNTFVNFFCQAWTITTYLELENNDKNFYSRIFNLFSFVLIFFTSVALFFERPFMHIYVGEEFRIACIYVPFLLVASLFQNYAAFFGAIIQSGKKNVFMLVSTLVAAIINLLLNYILISHSGILGACVATALSFLIVFVVRLVFSKNVIVFPLKRSRLITMLLIIIIQAIAVSYNYHLITVSVVSMTLILLLNNDCLLFLFKKYRTTFSKERNE